VGEWILHFLIILLLIIVTLKTPLGFDMLSKQTRADLMRSFAGGQELSRFSQQM